MPLFRRDAFPDDPPGRAVARLEPDGECRGVVLMLHGGTQQSTEPVDAGSASLWRTTVMRDRIAPRLLRHGYAVWLLRYAVRGWNGTGAPVADARWALAQVREAHPGVPVVLLGHSMGGRTAAYVADDPSVVGVVALAPWFDPADPVAPLRDRTLVAGHGLRDRITSAVRTKAFVERARAVARRAEFRPLGAAGHYMLYRAGRWNRFARDQSLLQLGDADGLR
ncbi:alpha/beta hydrolase [Marmoricola endophyticus]|uniref:Alpha/beta hydrolase n=1 Tax=Marmoricola endophyticus TaxID=2040280 RepID=A0A917BFJ1_9ACTN|nr:alpha/beta fold hydrolase [Marmoricola endophyticus]GGF39768.1 alpha/beta hydrolase [Marmoricola endophyticus]